ncbi:MAG: hypothetical protein HQL82_10010 [Magnetococcales bacterium]|nr:hypothetical protein [Magnetococcales bacterium]
MDRQNQNPPPAPQPSVQPLDFETVAPFGPEDTIAARLERWVDWDHLLKGMLKFSWVIMLCLVAFFFMTQKKIEETPRLYRAEITLMEVNSNQDPEATSIGGISGLLNNLTGSSAVSMAKGAQNAALISLNSRSFMVPIIEEENLLPLLFPSHWDPEKGTWKNPDSDKIPTLLDGFEQLRRVVKLVPPNPTSGGPTVTYLRVEWPDRHLAAQWANMIVQKLNEKLRAAAIQDSRARIDFLTEELKHTSYVEMRQAISSLFESEVKKAMMARLQTEFVYRVVDSAIPPREKEFIWPDYNEMMLTGLITGLLVGLVANLLVYFLHRGITRRLKARQTAT